jgi:hypothetical protein
MKKQLLEQSGLESPAVTFAALAAAVEAHCRQQDLGQQEDLGLP